MRTLQEYIVTGIPLDAKISAELLINIFIPNTPLHDGAVIIKGDRIAVTSAIFHLLRTLVFPKSLELVTVQPLVYQKFQMPLLLLYQKKLGVYPSPTMMSQT